MTLQVSVIVTAYNVAEYIQRAVMSVLAQQYVTLEVIVVDDASRDGTAQVVQSIADARVRLVTLEKNLGPGGARNQALALAQGEWVAILDGDDVWAPGRLAALLELAAREEAQIVCDNLLCVEEGDSLPRPMFTPAQMLANSPLTVERFIAENSQFISGFGLGYLKPMIRTDFLRAQRLRYDESIRIGEDYLFLLEALLKEAKCVLHPESMYHYTRRAGSISHRLTEEAVARIIAQDEALLACYALSDAARGAQAARTQRLREAQRFNALVDALKQRQWRQAVALCFYHPWAARHLAMPLKNRIRRVFAA